MRIQWSLTLIALRLIVGRVLTSNKGGSKRTIVWLQSRGDTAESHVLSNLYAKSINGNAIVHELRSNRGTSVHAVFKFSAP